jgi:hypothetical protein
MVSPCGVGRSDMFHSVSISLSGVPFILPFPFRAFQSLPFSHRFPFVVILLANPNATSLPQRSSRMPPDTVWSVCDTCPPVLTQGRRCRHAPRSLPPSVSPFLPLSRHHPVRSPTLSPSLPMCRQCPARPPTLPPLTYPPLCRRVPPCVLTPPSPVPTLPFASAPTPIPTPLC